MTPERAVNLLRETADQLERYHAYQLRIETAHRRVRQRRKRNRELTEWLATLILTRGEDAAAIQFGAETGLPPKSIAVWIERARPSAERQSREIRNRDIAAMARRGRSNAEIAERFGLSVTQVKRVWREQRAGRSAQSPCRI